MPKTIVDPSNPFRAASTGWYVYETLKDLDKPTGAVSLAVDTNYKFNLRIRDKSLQKFTKKVSFALWEMINRKGIELKVIMMGKEKHYQLIRDIPKERGNGKYQ